MQKFGAFTPAKNFFSNIFDRRNGVAALTPLLYTNELVDKINELEGALANAVQYVGLLVRFNYNLGTGALEYKVVGGGSGCNHFCGNAIPPDTGCFGDPDCNESACTGCYRTSVDGSTNIGSVFKTVTVVGPGIYQIEFDPALFSFVTPGNAVFVPAAFSQPWHQMGFTKVSDYVYRITTADLSLAPVSPSNIFDNNFVEIRFYKVPINVPF
jgi:hypothetical protein